MKHRERLLRRVLVIVALLFCAFRSEAQNNGLEAMDNVEVSILTCSPHDEVYSLYGHTALRYHDLQSGQDMVFNYGVFNWKQPFFSLRFMFGLTDYMLGLEPFKTFVPRYAEWGCEVTEQVLNLTASEKLRLTRALAENMQEENRVYRYNFFYDNCATRPRDIVERCIEGEVRYADSGRGEISFREMTHQYTREHPWAAVGNDLLLGLKADCSTTQREQEFLPENLCRDLDGAVVVRVGANASERLKADIPTLGGVGSYVGIGSDSVGSYEPLVSERRVLSPKGEQPAKGGFPLSPSVCGLLLLLLSVLIFVWEWRRSKTCVWWDVLLMLATGLAGVIIFLMLFSLHPCTTLNLTVLLLNPLPLMYIYNVARRRKTRFFSVQAVLVTLFLVGGFWQCYAEGLYFVALCLLLRCVRHAIEKSKVKSEK